MKLSEYTRKNETRSVPSVPYLSKASFGLTEDGKLWHVGTCSGIAVDANSALSIPAVYAAVAGLSDLIATLPFPVMKEVGQGAEKDYRHPVYKLLNREPNPVQTAKTYRAVMVIDLLTQGEHVSEIERDGKGNPVALWRIHPSKVKTRWADGGRRVRYFIDGEEYLAEDLLHVVSFTTDGVRGTSPLDLCSGSLALTLALERFGNSFFRNGSRPGGLLTVPPGLKPEDKDAAKKNWAAAHEGVDNASRTAVLPSGFEYKPYTIPPEEGQFNETRDTQLKENQRVLRVPPTFVGDYSRATWNNFSWARLDLVQNSVRPLVIAIEQEANRKLIGNDTQRYTEHVLEGLLRGSFSEQIDYLTKAVGGSIYTPNEARKYLGLPEIDGGDDLIGLTTPEPEPSPQPVTNDVTDATPSEDQ